MASFSLKLLGLALLLGPVVSRKYHIGPCLYVTDSEPCPDPDYIQVYLYTRKSGDQGQKIEFTENSDNMGSTNFNQENSNKIIIHGFNTDMYLDVLQDIRAAYLQMADVNVWMVNYPKLVHSGWCYLAAVKNVEHVGKCLVQLITALRRHKSNDIHVVGFSLGGQVPNYIATNLKGDKLDRITGLDPAGPGFLMAGKNNRLDPSDAKFVDVVHTNGGIQGYFQRCGHIDFYMNGGSSQPGCFKHEKEYFNCNHRRAPIYFAESINSKVGFLAWKCKNHFQIVRGDCEPKPERTPMGEHCPIGSSGIYLVHTASESPYAIGNRTITKKPLRQLFKEFLSSNRFNATSNSKVNSNNSSTDSLKSTILI